MWIRHFHGYGIGALCPPVSVKLENVFCLLDLIVVVHRWRGVGRHRVTRTLEWVSFWGCWNRDKQGSDDGDDHDDGGTRTVPNALLCLSGLLKMYCLNWKVSNTME